ncbi:MAG: ComEC/Rec2 family competence protein, partial [Rhodospirillaceae bacterium]|nr:ComEC/Rec2 family competence protein [Rhodospirillaceae bacterium]
MSQNENTKNYVAVNFARRMVVWKGALGSALGAERERWILWMPVFCGVGIGVYFSLNFEPVLWAGPLLVLLAGLALFATRNHKRYSLTLGLIPLFVFGLGFSAAGLATWSVDSPLLAHEIGPVEVSGQIVRVEHRPKSKRITLEKLQISALAPDKTPRSVRIVLTAKQPQFSSGDWVRVRATIKPPSPPAMPGAFDFQRQSYFRGLGGVGFSFGRATIEGRAPTTGTQSISFMIERVRENINLTVRSILVGEKGGIASALMTGDRAAIPKEIMVAMRNSGLAHLLAISGLHVGLIAGILFFSVRAILVLLPGLALRFPVKKWAAIAAMLGAAYYAIISGTTIPTQRAFLMLAFVLLAIVFDRQGISMRVVAWAGMVILLISPESMLGASFQLSFAAVVALVAFYEEFRDRNKYRNGQKSHLRKISYYVVGVALTTLVAGLATAPFAAFHFNSVATFGLLANLVAVPVTALWIMPAAVSAFVL